MAPLKEKKVMYLYGLASHPELKWRGEKHAQLQITILFM